MIGARRELFALVSLCAVTVSGATGVSDKTLLRMCPMAVEPVVDNVISLEERRGASTQYGLVSHDDGLMTKRLSVALVGYTKKGFYFATRTSVPEAPLRLSDGDRVTLTLLPPGAKKPFVFTKRVLDGRVLPDITEYGLLCAETEMFVPFKAVGVKGVKDGETWGLQMAVDFSAERETATWHWNDANPDELGSLVIDSACPIPSFVQFHMLEQWRRSANYRMAWRLGNNTGTKVGFSSGATKLVRGVGVSKLDAEAEVAKERSMTAINEFNGLFVEPGETKDVFHTEWCIWPGTVACLDMDIRAGEKVACRRKLLWDISRGKDWKTVGPKPPTLEVKFFPYSDNRLILQHCGNGVKDLCRGTLTVRGKRGNKAYWQQDLSNAPYFGRYDITLPGLPEDDYLAELKVENAQGIEYEHVRTFAVKKFPWQGNAIGKDRVIIPPFKPIAVSGDAISFLQTGYKAGDNVLWDELIGKGENILAAPMTLTLNGCEFKVTGARLLEQSPDRVIREVAAAHPISGLLLTVRQEYDYDGFCWVKLLFDAKDPVEVKSLNLSVPVRENVARYVDTLERAGDTRDGNAPDLTIPSGTGVVWNSLPAYSNNAWYVSKFPAPIHPYVYVGGAFKGFAWLIESVRDLTLGWDRSPQRLVRTPGRVTYEFDFVDRPTVWQGAKRIEMGFQPTPVKPRDPLQGKFAEQLYDYSCPSNAIHNGIEKLCLLFPLTSSSANAYPNGDLSLLKYLRAAKRSDPEGCQRELKAYVERNRAWLEVSPVTSPDDYYDEHLTDCLRGMSEGVRPRFFDPMMITCFWPEWEMYKGEWFPDEWTHDYFASEYMANLCPSRIDKLLWDGKIALEQGASGLFYDCFYSFTSACLSQDEVFLRPDGKTVQRSLSTMRHWREIMKRTAVLCYRMGKTYNGRPVAEFHDTMGAAVPLSSWSLTCASCERGSCGDEQPLRFPESFTLVNIIGANSGKGSHIIVSTRGDNPEQRNRKLIAIVAYMCAYGIFDLTDQGCVGGNARFDKAWNLVFDYGWGEPGVEQFCYWDEEKVQPVTHTGTNVRLTVGKRSDSALLMFGNLGARDEEVSFDVSGLGFGGGVELVDAESGEALSAPQVKVSGFEYRMIKAIRR